MQNTQTQLKRMQEQVRKLQAKNLQEFQKQILQQLYEIRECFRQQVQSIGKITNSNNVEDLKQIEQKSEKDKKIEQLEGQNRRLKYRIQHLVNNLRQARAK